MFIIILTYLQPLEVIETHLEAHRCFLDHHYASGLFLMSGPRVPCTGGVILAKGVTKESLERVLSKDPFYQERVATYEIIEFSPTKIAS